MFTLIELPYAMEALEPVISAQTLSFHHGKHLEVTGGQFLVKDGLRETIKSFVCGS